MLPDSRIIAAKEYLSLWEEHGLERLPGIGRLQAQLRTAKRRPVVPSTLKTIRTNLGDCKRCNLCGQRTNIVFGTGNPTAAIMFVGETPGTEEDVSAAPFVGPAGQLLDKIIEAMGYRREQVYLTNIVKCRPPNNRQPLPDEIAQCLPFLKAQIDVVNPKVLVALGATAANALLGTSSPLSQIRGRMQSYPGKKTPVMPTYHPAYLLRTPAAKREAWEDMKQVKSLLETLA